MLTAQELLDFLRPLGKLGLDPFLPLRAIRLQRPQGTIHLLGIPAEPSTQFTRDLLETAKLDGPVIVAALSGGYTGYASTVGEYVVHDYEGASSYWGRHFGSFVRQQLATLANAPEESPPPTGEAVFVRAEVPDTEPDDALAVWGAVAAEPEITWATVPLPEASPDIGADMVAVEGHWTPRKAPRRPRKHERGWPIPAGVPFVRLVEKVDGGGWRDLGVDDTRFPFAVWFEDGRWRWYAEVPTSAVEGKTVSFDIPTDPDLAPAVGSVPPKGIA